MTTPGPSIARASRAPLWKRALKLIDPITIIANVPGAVFQKEMWVGGRRISTYVVRGGFSLLLVGFVALVLLVAVLDRGMNTGPAAQLQQYQQVAPVIMMTIGWCMFVGLGLVALSRGAASIADERRLGTLGALMTTPLFAWQIVLGKLLGIMLELVILGLATTPLLLAVRTFGGLTAEVVVRVTSLTLLHSLLAATLALFCSVIFRRGSGAFLSALFLLVMLEVGPPLMAIITDSLLGVFGTNFQSFFGRSLAPESILLFTCSPAVMLFSMLEVLGGGMPGMNSAPLAANHMYYLGGWCVALFLATSAMLRRRLALDGAGASGAPSKPKRKKATPEPGTPEGADGGASAAPAKPRHAEGESAAARAVGDQPVLWRELQQTAFRKRSHLWVVAASTGLLLCYLYFKVGMDEEGLHIAISAVLLFAITCIGAVSTTSGISGERESRTWETLLTTPLSAREIVMGKFFGAIRKQWFVPLLLASHLALSVLAGAVDPSVIFLLPPVVLGPTVFLTATGILFSLLFKKSATAATVNFLLALACFGLAPMLIGMLMGMTSNLPLARTFFQWCFSGVLSFNPMAMGVLIVGGALRDSPMYRNGTYDFFDLGRLSLPEFALVTYGVVAITLLATRGVLHLTARRLCAESGRHR